ncbi:MAG: hypothetical protein RLZZ450_1425 [Pseudomonadota bacterium]|jgi:hypothetical protein
MMAMRTPRWLLLLSALAFVSGSGCGSDAPRSPTTPDDGDDGKTAEPSTEDDDDKNALALGWRREVEGQVLRRRRVLQDALDLQEQELVIRG